MTETFSDALEVLTRERVVFKGKSFVVSKADSRGSGNCIIICNVQATMDDDILELLLEKLLGQEFESSPKISFNRDTQQALVAFQTPGG
jgi:hypothetical protein